MPKLNQATAEPNYGRAALADPVVRQAYEAVARREGKPVYAILIRDYSHPPTIHGLDLSRFTGQAGLTIRVQASDDFEVARIAHHRLIHVHVNLPRSNE
ncbi:MAG: hypothetical protein KGS61_17495 [Verrucomicrobia bacterium]|nr:hypothetical protein [Verrucomicrobiota bacterium]